jgi:hypothetical protein
MSEETTVTEAPKRPRKLAKEITGTTLVMSINAIGEALTFTFDQFSDDIQQKLGMYGLSQKLGDAAAGKDGAEAKAAIEKVAEGLIKGDWSVRAPAAPKVTKKAIAANLDNMSDKEQKAARELLEKLGIKV